MSAEPMSQGLGWAPQACTLPTEQQRLRVAEFGDLFRTAVRSTERLGPGRLSIELVGGDQVAARAAGLAVRETGCCSFFTFTLTAADGRLILEVSVPDTQNGVLDALAARAAAGAQP